MGVARPASSFLGSLSRSLFWTIAGLRNRCSEVRACLNSKTGFGRRVVTGAPKQIADAFPRDAAGGRAKVFADFAKPRLDALIG